MDGQQLSTHNTFCAEIEVVAGNIGNLQGATYHEIALKCGYSDAERLMDRFVARLKARQNNSYNL